MGGNNLISEGKEGSVGRFKLLGTGFDGLGSLGSELLLGVVVGTSTDLALGFKAVDEFIVLPADLVGEVSQTALLAVRLEAQVGQGLRNDHLLGAVVGGRASLEALQVSHGSRTTSGLVGDHTSDGSPQHASGGFVVIRTLPGVGAHALTQEQLKLNYIQLFKIRTGLQWTNI